MGTRGHGTYAKVYRDIWTHPKTFRLASGLQAKLRVDGRWAVHVAVGQFHQLLCWCLAEQDDGQLGHLPPLAFARIVGWDEPISAEVLWRVWLESGFLDVHGPGDVVVHDLHEAAAELFRKRALRRRPDGSRPPIGRPPKPRPEATDDPEPPAGSGEPVPEPHDGDPVNTGGSRAEVGRKAEASARAFGSGSGSGNGTHTPRASPAPSANHADGCVCEESEKTERPGKPNRRPQDRRSLPEVQPHEDERLAQTWAEWLRGSAQRGLPQPRWSDDHRTAFDDLLDKAGENVTLACAAVKLYFAWTDPFLRDAGWSIKVFPHRVSALLVRANESIEKAERDRRAREAVAKAAAEAQAEPPADPARVKAIVASIKRGGVSE